MILEKFNNRDEQSWEDWKFRFASERWTRLARSWNWTWMALTRVCNHGVSRKDERWIPCFLLRLAPLRYSSSVPGATSDRSSISFSINLHWHRGPLPSQLPFNALNSKSYNVVHFGRTSSSIKFFQLFSFFFSFFLYGQRYSEIQIYSSRRSVLFITSFGSQYLGNGLRKELEGK